MQIMKQIMKWKLSFNFNKNAAIKDSNYHEKLIFKQKSYWQMLNNNNYTIQIYVGNLANI